LPWQRPFVIHSRLCLHRIAWPRKPTLRIKLCVASYHTTKVIAHQTPKPVIANCVPNWLPWQCPSAPMNSHPTHTDTDTLLKTYATNVRKYHSTMTVTYNSSTLQHYNGHYMIPTAHPSPQPKRHPYQFCRLCTDDRRVSLYFTMGRPFSPKNLPLPMGGSGRPSNTRFPGPTQVLNPNSSSIGAPVFAGLTSVTDQQTDRPTDHTTRSVRIGRIYAHSTAMRPNNEYY